MCIQPRCDDAQHLLRLEMTFACSQRCNIMQRGDDDDEMVDVDMLCSNYMKRTRTSRNWVFFPSSIRVNPPALSPLGSSNDVVQFKLLCIPTKTQLTTMSTLIIFSLFPAAFDVPPQEVLTKDSVTVSVDAVVYYRVSEGEKLQICAAPREQL